MGFGGISYPIKGQGARDIVLGGTIGPAGTGTPTVEAGRGFTVSRTAQGKYRITLGNEVNLGSLDDIKTKWICSQSADAVALAYHVEWKTFSVANGTLDFWVYSLNTTGPAIALADPAANDNTKISWGLILKNSSI